MKLIVPHYYPHFRCIADRCQHSCCLGWDVVIDDDTARRYGRIDGPFGERLRKAITVDEQGDTLFAMDASGRCPFLNQRGLCDIITTLGESALCQICADHPRFRNLFSSHAEIGLGLCCEAAADLILRQTEPMTLITLTDDPDSHPTNAESLLLVFRDKLIAIAQDRRQSLEEREHAILQAVEYHRKPLSAAAFRQIYLSAERLDNEWTSVLMTLQNEPVADVSKLTTVFEQLLVYFLYRHTAGAIDDDRLTGRTVFAVQSVRLIRLLSERTHGTIDDVIDLARRYCAEIEYSDSNPDMLFDIFG